ncbi:hypothetical protein DL98DRAFT_655164 [Cadophora sp. DSE1049]|nr:hypothetical protein DL98DRAFT_655164 [Cadophora sp. DSE1049]
MAILKDGNDTYEVRIKRYPDGTYFDEHIKVEEREKPDATISTRYIVGEAGMRYTIEFTLREGFDFGEYDRVQALLCFPGMKSHICHLDVFKPRDLADLTTEDITKQLEYADVTIYGRKMLGTRLAYRSLAADENLKKSTDVMGIDPESLRYFRVLLRKKVDEDSFSKDGITCAVGFVGGKPETSRSQWGYSRPSSTQPPSPVDKDVPLTEVVAVQSTFMNFYFRYRSADFIERTGIVPYPPPLYLYAWKDLTEIERKTALRELQEINKDHVHQALEAKSGEIIAKHGKSRKIDEPKEWRSWSKMYGWERELTFNTLKKAKRAHERGEVQRQFENNRGEIISLVDDEPKDDTRTKSKKRAVSTVENNDSNDDLPKPKSKVNNAGSGEPRVKDEPIDIDAPPAKKAKVKQNPAPADDGSDDEELRKKREKARKLAEDIEAEERLARMKRKQRALEAEIEAAEKRKSSKN